MATHRVVEPGVDNNGQTLINVATPAADTDAANKKYVDDAISDVPGGGVYTAGDGLLLDTGEFKVQAKDNGGLVVDDLGVAIDPSQFAALGIGTVNKFTEDIPSGSAEVTVTHSLGTTDVIVSIYAKTGGAEADFAIKHATTTTVTVEFADVPASEQWRIVIMG